MIIFYDKVSGDLLRFQVGILVNAASYATDGHLVIDPGGLYPLPEETVAAVNLNDLVDPVLADEVRRAIYGESGRFYVDVAAIPPALMEVAAPAAAEAG